MVTVHGHLNINDFVKIKESTRFQETKHFLNEIATHRYY